LIVSGDKKKKVKKIKKWSPNLMLRFFLKKTTPDYGNSRWCRNIGCGGAKELQQ